MKVMRSRSRLIYFRVSEEEYGWLQSMCERTHARSLSDLVRTMLLEHRNESLGLTGGLAPLAERIERLTALIEEMRVGRSGRRRGGAADQV